MGPNLELHRAVFEFSIAQMTALNTSPITLLPAISGIAYQPVEAVMMRTGARYATAGGNIQIRYIGVSPGVVALTMNAASGVLIQASVNGRYAWHTGQWLGQAGYSDATADLGSKGIEIIVATSNPTVDGTNPGSRCVLLLYYRVLPTYEEMIGVALGDRWNFQ